MHLEEHCWAGLPCVCPQRLGVLPQQVVRDWPYPTGPTRVILVKKGTSSFLESIFAMGRALNQWKRYKCEKLRLSIYDPLIVHTRSYFDSSDTAYKVQSFVGFVFLSFRAEGSME